MKPVHFKHGDEFYEEERPSRPQASKGNPSGIRQCNNCKLNVMRDVRNVPRVASASGITPDYIHVTGRYGCAQPNNTPVGKRTVAQ